MKIAISVGHNPDSPGATNGIYSEYSSNVIYAGMIISTLCTIGHKAYLIGTGSLQDKVEAINKLNVDYAVELHLNQGGGRGCETLYCPGSVLGKQLAETVHKELVENLPVKNRGVKEGWYHMIVGKDKDYFLEFTNCLAIITEPYFIDTELQQFNTLNFITSFTDGLCTGLIKFNEVNK